MWGSPGFTAAAQFPLHDDGTEPESHSCNQLQSHIPSSSETGSGILLFEPCLSLAVHQLYLVSAWSHDLPHRTLHLWSSSAALTAI
ncbi:hypothetical protein FKM82_001648 [Ascaphus truei]